MKDEREGVLGDDCHPSLRGGGEGEGERERGEKGGLSWTVQG